MKNTYTATSRLLAFSFTINIVLIAGISVFLLKGSFPSSLSHGFNVPDGVNVPVYDFYPPKRDAEHVIFHYLIIRDFPEFGYKSTSDWQRVNILREWVYQNADGGIDPSLMLDQRPDRNFYEESVPALFA
ncbi:MAG: hypothetical protein ACYC9O_18715, partial [Candidatus Latescibacterota bacterium]